jgi:hypothetical protein
MPKQKELKRLVRARMQKTGESYTTARTQILRKSGPRPGEFAALAGMRDAAVRAKTGRTWRQWVHDLDSIEATKLPHREIARHVHDNYDISGWWAQTVTVGYERIRGLREIGQRRSGSYEANKSKTFAVPIARLYRAFSVKRTRGRWLPGVDLKIRTSTVDKSMRITWPDETSVHAYFSAKGSKKSQVAIQHVGLATKADVAKGKQYWAERFEALAEIL